ncbi:YadA-like family protein [Ralstonia sp. NFACC01]|uniref:YadA-like family protein n=1 Tax=Ralstonia sp. NFACC01 TaxID=1566294 RepID=UPI0008E29226|nr:YadA-like family protein [Ralstonia sp. NFACC01]SFQ03906.1 Head domain of trimeric autotransporter adhesin [Ralstonia sp. NFACC01]
MNKSYKTIWNEALGAWVAASELDRAKGKGGTVVRRACHNSAGGAMTLVAAAVALLGSVLPGQAYAQVNCSTAPYNFYSGSTTCVGFMSIATQGGATAVGYGANSTGLNAIAVGFQAVASGTNSINVGARTAPGTGATADSTIGIGTDVTASGTAGIGIGVQSVASGNLATAVGSLAKATADNAVALGANAQATNAAATAVGNGAKASGNTALAIGGQAFAIGDGTVAAGQGAGAGSTTGNTGSVAVGIATGTLVSGAQNTAVGGGIASAMRGAGSGVTGTRNVAFGTGDGTVTYDGTLAASAGNLVSGNDNVAIGTNAGIGVTANGTTSVGLNAKASATGSIAIGVQSTAAGGFGVAVGNASVASQSGATAMGSGATASGVSGTAIGNNAVASGTNAVAMGLGARATATNSVSIGTNNVVSGANSGAIGDPSTITGSGSYSLGNNNTINANNAFVVGNGVTVAGGLDGAVVLGNASTVSAAVQTPNATIAGTTYTFAGGAPAAGDVVSVGSAAAPRQIQNVAAGRISSSSTDAVNGSQLFATNQAVNGVSTTVNNIQNGAGIKYFHANSTAADSQATGADSVAVGPLAVASGANSVATGNGAQAQAANALALGATARATNAGDVALGSGSVTAASNPTGSAVVAGVTRNFAGATPTSVVSVGALGAERQITNVAAGRLSNSSTDAVNGSQLFATNQAIDGVSTTVNNIQSGAGIKYFHANSTAADSQATGTDSVAVGPLAVASGVNSVAAGNGAQAQAASALALGATARATNAGDVALGSGSVTAASNPTASAVVAGATRNFAGTNPTSVVSVGALGAERQITNVAAGRLSNSSTDAVNGSQLFATNQAVDGIFTTVNNIQSGAGIKYFHANSTAADSQATGTDSVAVGPLAVASGANSVATGNGAQAQAANALALGATARATNAGDVALGSGSVTAASNPTASAVVAGATRNFAGTNPTSVVSVGALGAERQITNVAAGRLNNSSTDAVNGSQLFATNQAVDGIFTTVNNIQNGGGIKYFHANSTAADSQATGTDSVAVGPLAVASGANSVAMGNGAQATAANSVALGANSTTTANLGAAAYNPGTAALAGTSPVGEVSVGSAGNERRITNVAAGSAATDAVNVSQLQSVQTELTQTKNDALLWDPTANGGTGAFSANHGGTGPNIITNVAPGALNATSTDAVNGSQLFATNQNVTNLGNSITNIQNGGGIKYFHANSTAADSQVTGTDSVAIGPLAVATGATSLAAGNGAQAQTANALALGSLSTVSVAGGVAIGSGAISDRPIASGIGAIPAGSQAVPFNTSDGTLLGAVSFGSAAGNTYRQLTNVADGTGQHDAATIRQLTGALQSFAVTPTLYFHANSTAADSLAVGSQSVAVGPTTVVNGDNGVGIGNGAIVQQTAPGGIAIGQASTSGQADAIALGSGSTANGAQSIAQGANANAALAGGIAIGSGAKSNAVDAVALGSGANATFANSVALGAGSLTSVGALTNYMAFGLTAPQTSSGELNVGNRQITGVAAGRLGTDAVNVSQLQAVQQQLSTIISNNGGPFTSTSPNGTTNNTPPTTPGPNSSAGGTGSVASGSNSTALGNSSQATGNNTTAVGTGAVATGSGSTAIGAGSNDGGRTDVVSVGSSTLSRQVINVAAGTAPTDAVNVSQLNNAVTQANNYTDNQVAGLRNSIDSYRRDAEGGTAMAMAMAGLPQPTGPGKSMVAVAGSVYNGQSGQALGISTVSENNRWIYKAAVSTNTRGTYGAVVGAGYQW